MNTRLFGERPMLLFHSEFFVYFTTFSEQKVPLQEEKSNNLSRWIGVK